VAITTTDLHYFTEDELATMKVVRLGMECSDGDRSEAEHRETGGAQPGGA
jgi:hypothetical protein